MYVLKEHHLCEKQEHVAHYLPVRIESVFKGILPANHSFQGGEILNLLQIGVFS
jgi:hypothetical protein